MANYLTAVWRCRYFWLSLVKMDLRSRYRGSFLGMGWSLLHPIAMTVVLCIVFHNLFQQPIREYGPFLMAGLACWNFIVGVTTQGCRCLFLGEPYIRQYPTPLAIYPMRTALGSAIHFLLALSVVIAFVWIVNGFGNMPVLVSLIPSLLLFFVMGWSLAVLAGFANVYFQDTQHLSEVGFQILFYATPIIYPDSFLREKNLGWLIDYNPLASFLELVRAPILQGTVPTTAAFACASITTLVFAGCSALTLCRLQRTLVFHL